MLCFAQQCAGKELQVVVDTGCQRNIISSACLERLGLKKHIKSYKSECEKISLPSYMKVIGHIEHLSLTLGTILVDCAAIVAENYEKHFSLGLQTLKSLKCVINMEKHNLVLGKTDREEIPFVTNASAQEENTLYAPLKLEEETSLVRGGESDVVETGIGYTDYPILLDCG
ncbi:hypothetical protein JD844_021785 [Phrynosoma platyrhinos]|uniref:Aspartic peptidase DDI1-type domain-containing protein n=1 Tax=Phrynosoma platyrhinos TaxID=52577 RepID=A0ABQ7SUG5_PHRPL|nr:hypothetical protein JD844_021785 [Phrynosoma platyrhinos]